MRDEDDYGDRSSPYDDDSRFDDNRGGSRGDRIIERAKSKTLAPAICLIIFGVIAGLNGLYNLYYASNFQKEWADQVAQSQKSNPSATPQQKKEMQDLFDKIEKPLFYYILGNGVIGSITALMTVVAGFMLKNLKARSLCYWATILSMIPICSTCCLLGLPLGIWVLLVLGNEDVKDGFAAVARNRD